MSCFCICSKLIYFAGVVVSLSISFSGLCKLDKSQCWHTHTCVYIYKHQSDTQSYIYIHNKQHNIFLFCLETCEFARIAASSLRFQVLAKHSTSKIFKIFIGSQLETHAWSLEHGARLVASLAMDLKSLIYPPFYYCTYLSTESFCPSVRPSIRPSVRPFVCSFVRSFAAIPIQVSI
jgi:hypothetical protein